MYLAHWGLQAPPFRNAIDPHYFFQSPTHDEALARLHFIIEGEHRAGLLLGHAGSGKSLLLEVLAVEARRRGRPVAKLSLLGLDKQEFLWRLAAVWGLDLVPTATACELWRVLADHVITQHLERVASVVLLDDAEEATADVLAQVLRLAQTDVDTIPATTLILAARTQHVGRLGERLLELADLRIDLLKWNAQDVQHYLEDGLARAGRHEPAFAPEAITLLAEISQGVPRNVVQLADLALIAAAGQELALVDSHTVESVVAELGVVHQLVDTR
jgi:type II secretory pathway predicted ATPase ExeA